MNLPSPSRLRSLCLLGLLGLIGPGCLGPQGAAHEQAEAGAGTSSGDWLEPWPHHQASEHDSPYVHLFGLEPAFLDRDLFLDFRTEETSGTDMIEIAAELEWALTRRIGLVVEAPYERLSPAGERTQSGLGDLALALRLLLVDSKAFLLSSNLELSLPSGSERRGLGSGETGIAPSLSAWFDLGNRLQASVQIGTEHGLESEDTELFYAGALAYSFRPEDPLDIEPHDHSSDHAPSGLTSVMLEFTGRTALDGALDRRDSSELLFGISRSVTETWGLRGAYQVSIGDEKDFDSAVLLGLVYHF